MSETNMGLIPMELSDSILLGGQMANTETVGVILGRAKGSL